MRGHHSRNAFEQVGPDIGIEVDRNVATEDDIEQTQIGEWLKQVAMLERDELAYGIDDLPSITHAREVFVAQVLRHAARHLESGVDPGLGRLQRRRRNVRRQNLDIPAVEILQQFMQDNPETVRFLAATARCRPDPQSLSVGSLRLCIEDFRQAFVLQRIKRPLIAEEQRFACRHRINKGRADVRIISLTHQVDQITQRLATEFGEQRGQATFDQVRFAGIPLDPGNVIDQSADAGNFLVVELHGRLRFPV